MRHIPRHHNRIRRHVRSERGAALFVVLLALLLLSGLGLWAIHSASVLGRASGYSRAGVQAQYLAEMGILSGTSLMTRMGMAEAQRATGNDTCWSVPATAECRSIGLDEISVETYEKSTQNLADTDSFSVEPTVALGLQGDFQVEFSGFRGAIAPGVALQQANTVGPRYERATVTSYGVLRPQVGSSAVVSNLCAESATPSTAQNSAAGRVAVRAHAIIGPL